MDSSTDGLNAPTTRRVVMNAPARSTPTAAEYAPDAVDCTTVAGHRPPPLRMCRWHPGCLTARSAAGRLHSIAQTIAVPRKGARMDDRVASAIAHWAPRFTTNGVTVSDFQRVTGQVERWEDWCAAWSAVGAEHEALGRRALDEGGWSPRVNTWPRPRSTSTSPSS